MINLGKNKRYDYLELHKDHAKQASLYYSKYFSFKGTAYCEFATGERKISSFLMEQGGIRFVLSSSLKP
jgi:4-hydroxyphenylpyruvate dioxygenase